MAGSTPITDVEVLKVVNARLTDEVARLQRLVDSLGAAGDHGMAIRDMTTAYAALQSARGDGFLLRRVRVGDVEIEVSQMFEPARARPEKPSPEYPDDDEESEDEALSEIDRMADEFDLPRPNGER